MIELAGDLYLLLAAIGLSLAVGYAGLPLLGQGAFVAVGAFGTALLDRAGAPLGLSVGGAVAAGVVVGHVVGRAGARLHGAFLALATWGLAWLTYAVLLGFPDVSGGSAGWTLPTPARVVSPALGVTVTLTPAVHVVVAAVACAAALTALARLERGPAALDLGMLREGPVAADALGVEVGRVRRNVIAAGAGAAALAGAGGALLAGGAAPADYSPLLSLQLFAAVLLVALPRWWAAVPGAAVVVALPHVADGLASAAGTDEARVSAALTAGLLVAVIAARPVVARGIAARLPAPKPRPVRTVVPAGPTRPPGALSARGVAVRFGGVRALDDVALDVLPGEVHALVGPNGSGKTTLLRVLSGALVPDAGEVTVGGDVLRPAGGQAPRVHAGVVRTTQHTVALAALTPAVQARAGARVADGRRAPVWRHLLGAPSSGVDDARRAARAATALETAGLAAVADTPTEQLTAGEQRLLQLARALATGATALLLDEPAAGMSAPERERLAAVLRAVAAQDVSVVLVEHDMRLVGRVADRVTVLADGRVLMTATPDEVRADPRVRAVYLGAAWDDARAG